MILRFWKESIRFTAVRPLVVGCWDYTIGPLSLCLPLHFKDAYVDSSSVQAIADPSSHINALVRPIRRPLFSTIRWRPTILVSGVVFFSRLFGEKETSSNASPIHELGKFLWDIEVTSGDDGKEAIIFHNHMDLTLLSLSKQLQQLKKEKTQIFLFCGGGECECQRDGAGAVYFSEISLFRCVEWTHVRLAVSIILPVMSSYQHRSGINLS